LKRAMSVLCPLFVVCAATQGCSSATDPSAATNQPASNPARVTATRLAVLPTLGRPNSCAQGVSDPGTAVGESEGNDFNLHAVSWTGGAVSDLGTLGGPTSTAYAISYRGTIVGTSVNGAGLIHAFVVSSADALVDLGDLGGGFSSALGVNNWGLVVGSSTDSGSVSRAFIWAPKTGMHTLTPSSLECLATSISDSGIIVGDCTNSQGVTSAFAVSVLSQVVPTGGVGMRTLPGLGGTFSIAWSVNTGGEIVGESATPDGVHHAVKWSRDGTITALGGTISGTPSFAYAVNTEGTVAGAATDSTGKLQAVQWSARGTMTSLGNGGQVSSVAFGIDSRGGVVGCAFDANGNSEALWWGNGAPASSASVLALAPSSGAGGRATEVGPIDYHYGPSSSNIARLGIHAGSPAAMRVLRFGQALGHVAME
jgi:probable HAF family extracellular repeat protein